MAKHLKIGILVYPGCTSSMVTGVWDIFTLANGFYSQQNKEVLFHLNLVGETTSPINSFSGLTFTPQKSIRTKEVFDIIYIPGFMGEADDTIEANRKLINWISRINSNQTILTAACNGNFLLAASGQLNGRSATTHWNLIEKFKKDYGKVKLYPEKIIVDNGNVVSAAGVTSYFNLALHLIQRFAGAEISFSCAKVFLVDSGRKIQTPYQMLAFSKSHGDELIVKTQDWIERNYQESITLVKLEKAVNTGVKTLTRRFMKVTGVTPKAYLQKLRIETAKRLLESGNLTFSEITCEVGYNDASSFHRAFKEETGLTPIDYRNKFSFS